MPLPSDAMIKAGTAAVVAVMVASSEVLLLGQAQAAGTSKLTSL